MYVGASLEAYGEFSQAEVDFILPLLRPESVVMDIGANYGALTLPIARHVRLVYAFEPQRPVFCGLAASMALNCIENVVCENIALAAEPGFITVPRLDFTASNNIGGVQLGRPGVTGRGFYAVRAESLDEYVRRNRIRRLDFLKIDVEGMEEAVLRGGEQTIRSLRPLIYLEADRQEKLPSLQAFLSQLGYTHELHTPPLFNPNNFRGNRRNIWQRELISRNWLCRPGSQTARNR